MKKKPATSKTAEQAKIAEREHQLDEALEETFPASDPVASLEPSADHDKPKP